MGLQIFLKESPLKITYRELSEARTLVGCFLLVDVQSICSNTEISKLKKLTDFVYFTSI